MATLRGILDTIKRNTLDKTDIDEKIGSFVGNAVNSAKNFFTPQPLISPQPEVTERVRQQVQQRAVTPTPSFPQLNPTPTPAPTPQLSNPKTNPGQKLMARLDSIKAKNAVGGVLKYGYDQGKQIVKDYGSALYGTLIKNPAESIKANMDVNLLEKERQARAEQDAKNIATLNRLKAEGNVEGYNYLKAKMMDSINDRTITNKSQEIVKRSDEGIKKTISDGIKSGEAALTAYAGAPKALTNILVGSGLSYVGSKALGGEDPYQDALKGGSDAFGYTGLTSLITNPIIDKVAAASGAKNFLLNQLFKRGVNAGGNVLEDELIGRLNNQEITGKDRLLSAIIGAGMSTSANEPIAKVVKKKVSDNISKPAKEWSEKFFGNQYTKIARKYNQAIDNATKPATPKEPTLRLYTGMDGNQLEINGKKYPAPDFDKGATPEEVYQAMKEGRKNLSIGFEPDPEIAGSSKRVLIGSPKGEVDYKLPTETKEELMAMAGGLGMEKDENGNWKMKYDPARGLMFAGATAGLKTEAGKKMLSNLKLPEKLEFPKASQAFDAIAKEVDEAKASGSLTDAEINQSYPSAVRSKYTDMVREYVEQRIGRNVTKDEIVPLMEDVRQLLKDGGTANVEKTIASDNYLSQRFGYNKNAISSILKNQTPQDVVGRLKNADPNRLIDSEPVWTPRRNQGIDNDLLTNFDENGNPISGKYVKKIEDIFKPKAETTTVKDAEEAFLGKPLTDGTTTDGKPVTYSANPSDTELISKKGWDKSVVDDLHKLGYTNQDIAQIDTDKAIELLQPKPSLDQSDVTRTLPEVKPQPSTKFEASKTEVENLRQAGYTKINDIYTKAGISPEEIRTALKEGNLSNPQVARLKKSFVEMAKMAGIPEEVLKEQYFPDIHKDQKLTIDNSYGGSLASTLFDFTKKNTGAIADENLLKDDRAVKQYWDWALSKKYGDVLQTEEMMKSRNIPADKADEVLKIVQSNKKDIDEVVKPHLQSTSWGDTLDYIAKNQATEDQLSLLNGQTLKRPLIQQRAKTSAKIAFDGILKMFRSEDNLLRRYTNDDIYNSFKQLRDRQLFGNSRKVALQNFIDTVSKYDYEDKQVKNVINQLIDTELKKGQHENTIAQEALNAATQTFSRANIGGNIKTVVTQPFEVYRIASEYSPQSLKDSVVSAFKRGTELDNTYGLKNEWQNTLQLKFQETEPKGFQKWLGKLDTGLYKGIEMTESWKNRVFAAAAEAEGKKKGLSGDSLKTFVRDEVFRIAHNANEYNVPVLLKNKPLANALLQYSQFAWKNLILKVDTLEDKNYKKLAKLLGADIAAMGSIAAITGVSLNSLGDWLGNTVVPTGFGPLVSYPYQLYKDYTSYQSDKQKYGEDNTASLAERWGKTSLRNIVPAGGQISKTSNTLNILNKGYKESKNGNVIYATGERNPVQTAQAVVFGEGSLPEKKQSDKVFAKGENPMLSKTQSKVLKDLPKEQMRSYYEQESGLNRDIKKQQYAEASGGTATPKRSLLDIFSGKSKEAKAMDYNSLNSEQKSFQRRVIKQKLDTGVMPSDSELQFYYFDEVNKMDGKTASDKQKKNIATYKAVDSIYSNENLSPEAKDRLIELSGLDKDDVVYYNEAKDDATVKALRQEEALSTMSKQDWLDSLASGRRMVGNKQVVDNSTLDQLYERGSLSDSERDYLKAIKFDPATGKYYMDRDYAGGGESKAQKDKRIKDIFGAQEDIIKSRSKLREELSTPKKKASSAKQYILKQGTAAKPSSSLSKLFNQKIAPKSITQSSPARVKMSKSKYRFK